MKRAIEEFITILSVETGEVWGNLTDAFKHDLRKETMMKP